MRFTRFAVLAVVMLGLTLVFIPAHSQGFFDRGKDLLKGLGGDSSSSDMSSLTTEI